MASRCPYSTPTISKVKDCPFDKQTWTERAKSKGCSKINYTCDRKHLEYHCLLNAFQNETIEVCAPKTWLSRGWCPAFSVKGERITDIQKCSQATCPKQQFFSNIIYNYPPCLQKKNTTKKSFYETTDWSLVVCLSLSVVLILLLLAYVWYLVRQLMQTNTDFLGKRCFQNCCGFSKRNNEHQHDPEISRRSFDSKGTYIEEEDSADKPKEETATLLQDMKGKEVIRILILGETGVGKSSTGNTILNKAVFFKKLSAQSVTEYCKLENAERMGKMIYVLDTPGLFDTSNSHKRFKSEIQNMMNYTEPGPHAILLVLSAKSNVLGTKAVKYIVKKFGKRIYDYCILVLTCEDELIKAGETLQSFLTNASEKLKDIRRRCKGREIAIDNVTENVECRNKKVEKLLEIIESLKKLNISLHSNDHIEWYR